MNKETRETLEFFIEKAERLGRSGFINRIQEQGAIWVSRRKDQQEWNLTVTEDDIDAFLLTFRMFIQKRDEISLQHSLPQLTGMSDEWANVLAQANQELNAILDSQHANIVIEGQNTTRREVLDTFLYGNRAHGNTQKREKYKRWKNGDQELFGNLLLTFAEMLAIVFTKIQEMSAISKIELKKQNSRVVYS